MKNLYMDISCYLDCSVEVRLDPHLITKWRACLCSHFYRCIWRNYIFFLKQTWMTDQISWIWLFNVEWLCSSMLEVHLCNISYEVDLAQVVKKVISGGNGILWKLYWRYTWCNATNGGDITETNTNMNSGQDEVSLFFHTLTKISSCDPDIFLIVLR